MGRSLPVACALLGGVARAAYVLELDWLVTRLMTLCSVCTGWGICKGLWSGGASGCFTRPSKGGRVGLP